MDEKDRKIFEQMSLSLKEISDALKKQQPGKFDQVIATGATIATIVGVLSIADIIIKWITGG
jgi:hypothetical protein